jgi:hypothetical protein
LLRDGSASVVYVPYMMNLLYHVNGQVVRI